MKKTLFIMTHLGSGWERLSSALEECPRFHVFQTGFSYNHPDDIKNLISKIHRRQNSASVWVDTIFHNKDFTMKRLCSHYKFIFWSCPLEECLAELVQKHGYHPDQAKDYWSYRMAGLKLYHQRSSESLWNPDLDSEALATSVF